MKVLLKLTLALSVILSFSTFTSCGLQKKGNMDKIVKTANKSLFDTTKIGTMTLKNRFFRASVGDHNPTCAVDDRMLIRYENLAAGGVGTIITGYTLVDSAEKNMAIMGMYDDSFIEGNRRLVETVHSHGANILMQLVYIGSNFHARELPERILSASAVPNRNSGITPEAMTSEEIKHVVQEFADAALRAKKAGFDGVEIHGCHGYLLNQFLSPYYNRRNDEYGGSRENRSRIVIEVYQAIRNAVGNNYPVFIKVQSSDGYEGGVTNDDCMYLCKELAKLGIDAIEVSGNFMDYNQNTAYFEDIANKIAKQTEVPVIVTGGNRDFHAMQEMLDTTAIDYVGMARPLLKNPDLINEFYKEYHEK